MNFDFSMLNLIAPEIVLLSSSAFALLLTLFVQDKHGLLSYILAQGSLLITFAALVLLTTQGLGFSNMVINDPISLVAKGATLLLGLLSFVFAREYMHVRGFDKPEFYVLGLFAILGMMIMISAYSFLMIYLGLELMSLSLYAMVVFNKEDDRVAESAMKYFVLGAVASGLMLYGMSFIYGIAGSLQLHEVGQVLISAESRSAPMLFGMTFVVVGMAFKLGAVPFHMWLPDVYEGAPTAVTMFMSAVPKVAAVVMMIRFLDVSMSSIQTDWASLLSVMAVLSLIIGSIVAIAQESFKRMLAYGTIGHVGFILLGIMSGNLTGYAASMFYVVAYGLMSIGGFALIIYLTRKNFEAENLDALKGLNDRSRLGAFAVLVLMFSMAGVPFTLGFWAKLSILKAIVDTHLWLAVFAVVMSVISAFYYLRVIKMAYFDTNEDTEPPALSKDFSLALLIVVLVVMGLGLYPAPVIEITSAKFGMV